MAALALQSAGPLLAQSTLGLNGENGVENGLSGFRRLFNEAVTFNRTWLLINRLSLR